MRRSRPFSWRAIVDGCEPGGGRGTDDGGGEGVGGLGVGGLGIGGGGREGGSVAKCPLMRSI